MPTPADDEPKPLIEAISGALNGIYDQVAVNKDSVLRDARQFDLAFQNWEEYQQRAGLKVMDSIADGHIKACKLKVTGLGAAAGFGGYLAIIPDAIQFVTFTLRMVTGIAAAYGFDPHPDSRSGRDKVLVLQAYLNANLGNAGLKGVEKAGLSVVAKMLRNAALRSDVLVRLILAIARLVGIRLSKGWLLKSLPLIASGANAGFNYYFASEIGRHAKAEFREFRDGLRQGKYKNDPAYDGMGN